MKKEEKMKVIYRKANDKVLKIASENGIDEIELSNKYFSLIHLKVNLI